MPEPIVSVAAMRVREERTWAAGVSRESVIRRAGVAVSRVALGLTNTNDPVLVLAGPGQNGGDAVVAEQHLGDRDSVLARCAERGGIELARQWLAEHRGNPRALVIDGLFGIGLARPLEGAWRELIEAVNASQLRVVAVDVPSGIDADTGEVKGAAIHATVTVTLGSVKQGLLRQAAAPCVGRIELAHDIGLVPIEDPSELLWVMPSDFADYPPRRGAGAHKGNFGHVAVIAGSVGYHGAGVLAARGALRARPGLVTVFTDEACYIPVAAQLQAAMVHPWKGERIDDSALTTIVAGPGLASPRLSPTAREEISRLWREAPCPMIADASALDWLPIGDLGERAGLRVLTPHPGEAGRLLGVPANEVQSDRFRATRRLADLAGEGRLQVVLKGQHTIVGASRGPLHVNSSGNPGLAQGGTGDFLAGFLGGLLAQPGLRGDPQLALRYGVWRHGVAGDELEARGGSWTSEDLDEAMRVGNPAA
jgi:hydroxyethylthiazole kinase-like uncharacterized protein yjeF